MIEYTFAVVLDAWVSEAFGGDHSAGFMHVYCVHGYGLEQDPIFSYEWEKEFLFVGRRASEFNVEVSDESTLQRPVWRSSCTTRDFLHL